ncbi:MAG: FAD-binding protein [Candidatus Sumerlaeota bacterium]|nr:FAD-binding protein [Candidatus Sumerlaeota bacterium]
MIRKHERTLQDMPIPVFSLNTLIVGSGAAGLGCAAHVFREFEEAGIPSPATEVAIVTRGLGLGTSNNSGSDKQTYYRLGPHGAEADSPWDFARTLAANGCMHGDLALIEGENSLRAFHHLVEAGVPFPHNAMGGFVGYKTDHDPRQRGTSAGPWTSRLMTRKLLAAVKRFRISVFNRHHALAIIVAENMTGREALGLLCVNMTKQRAVGHGLVLFHCRNVVMAGGGPGELYEYSVYPKGQMGPYAPLFEAGAEAVNLTESQYGITSREPRWALSGSYQQVIPRYYSVALDGSDEQEFLAAWFESTGALASATFLKGYQWPLDIDCIANQGSSLIDLLVFREIAQKGRKVFLDFRRNPRGPEGRDDFQIDRLSDEAASYLRKCGATQATPIERLAHMNPLSVQLYRERGVDLWKEPLEIAVSAQHCNGGFAVNGWWESDIQHLFVIGELAGTHGVKRPGGSALNSGQVGALRAAQRIAHLYAGRGPSPDDFERAAQSTVSRFVSEIRRVEQPDSAALPHEQAKREIQRRMSEFGGPIRSLAGTRRALAEALEQWRGICDRGIRQSRAGWLQAWETRELALTQLAFLHAIQALLERGEGSRGSHLVTDANGALPHPSLEDHWRLLPENPALRNEILSIAYDAATDSFRSRVEAVRPIPEDHSWFENTWRDFREGRVFM